MEVGLEKKRIYNTRMYYKHVYFINNSLYDNINTETIYLNKFQINKIITKKENYYNCYKVRLEVKSQDRSVNLESYVTKK